MGVIEGFMAGSIAKAGPDGLSEAEILASALRLWAIDRCRDALAELMRSGLIERRWPRVVGKPATWVLARQPASLSQGGPTA